MCICACNDTTTATNNITANYFFNFLTSGKLKAHLAPLNGSQMPFGRPKWVPQGYQIGQFGVPGCVTPALGSHGVIRARVEGGGPFGGPKMTPKLTCFSQNEDLVG